jgi:hypothetical protein
VSRSTWPHDLGRQAAADTAPVGEEQPFAEREGLHGQADVDRQLEEQAMPGGSNVGDGLAELVREWPDGLECFLVAADHQGRTPSLRSVWFVHR